MQLFMIIILVVSFTFAFVGITTDYWYQSLANEFNEGLWTICRLHSSTTYSSSNTEICNRRSYMKSQGLAVSGIILLTISLVLLTIQRYRINDRRLSYITIGSLIGSTLLLMLSYFLFPREFNFKQLGYSIYFMICSTILNLITTGLVAFRTRTIQPIN